MRINGPALIEEQETTTVVPAGASATVRDDGAIVVAFEE
jgi:N-methylhydantoinase A/oxoprolinase/acetone carboxylase beta subunit